MSASLGLGLADTLRRIGDRIAAQYELTPREHEVLAFAYEGLDRTATSERLEISAETVKWHMGNIYYKTGVVSRQDLLRLALRVDTSDAVERTRAATALPDNARCPRTVLNEIAAICAGHA